MNEIIRIGCSGWSYKEWKGLIYPERLPPAKYLAYYAEHFDTVEVNSTFYRLPSIKTVQCWYTNVPSGFKFSLKINRQITHLKRLKQSTEELKIFYGYSDILKEKMGPFLFQFPRSFIFNEERLESLLANLNPSYENVVEFRHQSWWNSKVFEALSHINTTFCSVSGLDVPDDLIALKGRAYIRFHGDPHYSSSYSDKDLKAWSGKIRVFSIKNLWAYFNNTAKGYAPENALNMMKLLSK